MKVNRIGGLYDNEKGTHQAGSVYDTEGLSPTVDTVGGGYRMPMIMKGGDDNNMNLRIRKLTPKECWRLPYGI